MYDRIKRWYDYGLWTAAMVAQAVEKGLLTQAQADSITG
jgi:hypothetical protein